MVVMFMFSVVEAAPAEILQDLPPAAGALRERTISTMSTTSRVSTRSARKIREVFRQESRLSSRQPSMLEINGKVSAGQVKLEEVQPVKGKLMEEEHSAVGRVPWNVYDIYFKNASYKAVIGVLTSYTLFNAFNIGGSFWLTAWTGDAEDPVLRNSTEQRDLRLGIYGMFGGLQGGQISSIFSFLFFCLFSHSQSVLLDRAID